MNLEGVSVNPVQALERAAAAQSAVRKAAKEAAAAAYADKVANQVNQAESQKGSK